MYTTQTPLICILTVLFDNHFCVFRDYVFQPDITPATGWVLKLTPLSINLPFFGAASTYLVSAFLAHSTSFSLTFFNPQQ